MYHSLQGHLLAKQKKQTKKELVVVVVVAVCRHMEYTWADVVRTIQCFKRFVMVVVTRQTCPDVVDQISITLLQENLPLV